MMRLAYPNTRAKVADDLGRDTFIAGLHNRDLQKWIHQACPQSFTEACPSALQGETCFHMEEDQEMVWAVCTQAPGGSDHLSQMLECILAQLDAGRAVSPQLGGCFQYGELCHFKYNCPLKGMVPEPALREVPSPSAAENRQE